MDRYKNLIPSNLRVAVVQPDPVRLYSSHLMIGPKVYRENSIIENTDSKCRSILSWK